MKETAEIIGKDLDLSQTIDEYNAEVLRNPASQQSRFVAIPLPTKPNQEGTWLGNKKKSNKQCFWMLENETVCGKTFAKNDSLRRHIEAEHKGIKPYACRYGHCIAIFHFLYTNHENGLVKTQKDSNHNPPTYICVFSQLPLTVDYRFSRFILVLSQVSPTLKPGYWVCCVVRACSHGMNLC